MTDRNVLKPPRITDEDHEAGECGPNECFCVCDTCMDHGMSGWA